MLLCQERVLQQRQNYLILVHVLLFKICHFWTSIMCPQIAYLVYSQHHSAFTFELQLILLFSMSNNQTLQSPYYSLLTLKYKVKLLNMPLSSFLRQMRVRFWQWLAACKNVFQLCYSNISTTYLLLRYKRTGSFVMECKCASVTYVYKLLYLLHTSRSTGI